MIRWNNFPRVVDIKHMDNVGATLHTALLLAYIEEKKTGEKIDTYHIIKRILFVALADLVLSDINSGTKNYIKRVDAKIFDTLYERAYEFFLTSDAPGYIKEDMKSVLTGTGNEKENMICVAAKKYVGHFEAAMNAKVHSFIYEVPLSHMEEEFQEMEWELMSLATLRKDENLQKYLSHIFRLSYAMRWNQHQRNIPVSVMSHKVIVAFLTYVLAVVENHHGGNNDVNAMLYRAIYHDVPEVITGDIVTPTKKAVPGLIEVLETVEKKMLDDYLFSYIDDDYRDFIMPYILEPFHDIEWQKVKYADILSALFEAQIEVSKWNTSFQPIVQSIRKRLIKVDHVGVQFLLQEFFMNYDEIYDDIIPPVWDL